MKIALDTNRYSDFARAVPDVVQVIEQAETVYLPFAVLAELRAGFFHGTRGRANEGDLQEFLQRTGVHALYPDEQTSFHYATIYRQLRGQGTLIPVHDVWIAALTIQYGLTLYARDKHFDHLPQLPRL